VKTLTKFADQLYDDLMREHGASLRALAAPATAPARAHRRRVRPVWATAAGAATAGAVATGLVVFGGAAAPAYAVTQNADGTVSVAVHQKSAIDAANARLKQLGDRVVVVPVRPGCVNLNSIASKDAGHSETTIGIGTKDGTLTIDAKGVPAGETMVIGFDDSPGAQLVGSAPVKGKVPDCVSLPTPGSLPPGASLDQSGPQAGVDNNQGTTSVH
jgi:hypothetical protein